MTDTQWPELFTPSPRHSECWGPGRGRLQGAPTPGPRDSPWGYRRHIHSSGRQTCQEPCPPSNPRLAGIHDPGVPNRPEKAREAGTEQDPGRRGRSCPRPPAWPLAGALGRSPGRTVSAQETLDASPLLLALQPLRSGSPLGGTAPAWETPAHRQVRCWARVAEGVLALLPSSASARRPGWAPSCYKSLHERKEIKDELRWRDGFLMGGAMIIIDNSGSRYRLLSDFSVPSTVTSMTHTLSSCPCKVTSGGRC